VLIARLVLHTTAVTTRPTEFTEGRATGLATALQQEDVINVH